jgi:glutaredoxin
MEKYTIYTKDNCSFCTRVKELMKICSLEYTELKLDQDFFVEEFKEKFENYKTFPVVLLGDTVIGGAIDFVAHLKDKKLI